MESLISHRQAWKQTQRHDIIICAISGPLLLHGGRGLNHSRSEPWQNALCSSWTQEAARPAPTCLLSSFPGSPSGQFPINTWVLANPYPSCILELFSRRVPTAHPAPLPSQFSSSPLYWVHPAGGDLDLKLSCCSIFSSQIRQALALALSCLCVPNSHTYLFCFLWKLPQSSLSKIRTSCPCSFLGLSMNMFSDLHSGCSFSGGESSGK